MLGRLYLRVALRLSFRLIANFTQDLFHKEISRGTIDLFFQQTADSHEPTEERLLKRILESPERGIARRGLGF